MTIQTDFINPLNNNFKLEGGLKAVMRNNRKNNRMNTQGNDMMQN